MGQVTVDTLCFLLHILRFLCLLLPRTFLLLSFFFLVLEFINILIFNLLFTKSCSETTLRTRDDKYMMRCMSFDLVKNACANSAFVKFGIRLKMSWIFFNI